jgi:hypothetical protein
MSLLVFLPRRNCTVLCMSCIFSSLSLCELQDTTGYCTASILERDQNNDKNDNCIVSFVVVPVAAFFLV